MLIILFNVIKRTSLRPLDDATLLDRKRLKDEYGIKTIMDLRTLTEHANQAKKREGDVKVPALLQSNSALAEPVKIPGMKYLEINVNGKGFECHLLWRLKFWSFLYVLFLFFMAFRLLLFPHYNTILYPKHLPTLTLKPSKLVTLMLFGYRMEAISILGREVMLPRGLIGLGYDSLDACGPEIAECLQAFTDPSQPPILIHCTQGKDRTGLIVALLLLILGVPLEAIAHDYVMSEQELECEKESRMVEIRSIGLSEHFATCPPDWIECMDGHLREKYGGLGRYLRRIGVSDEEEEELIRVLGVVV
ncbi:hypothetical protein ONS96_002387 [Cadophora gregata f. sp. sojae]|nr:hypothetical protein ONS96_002387 [Cadophora gregata f. sp. sojae]